MSNYYCATRTNYFHVKNEEKFRELMAKVEGSEDSIELWDDKTDKDGNQLFGFGVYGCISGVLDDSELDDDPYEVFINGLKECVADDDAILIFEVGHEKLRYVDGGVTIITSKSIEYLNLQNVGCKKAQELLYNNNWTTECDD